MQFAYCPAPVFPAASLLSCDIFPITVYSTATVKKSDILFAGRIDMLTIMAMRWNQQKHVNLAFTLARRYRKVKTLDFTFCYHIVLVYM